MYIGRDFKRDIELDNLKENARILKPNRSWLDLFSLSLSDDYNSTIFDFTNLTDNLREDEVIILDSHDDIFKDYQIYFWRKDRISDILPAIKCPSFKPETKIFKTSEMEKMRKFIYAQKHTKSIVIENADEKIFINLIYGNTIKILFRIFTDDQPTEIFNKLKERYELWEIGDCACKPKKIRVWENKFEGFQYTIEDLERISIIKDAKLGINIVFKNYCRSFPIIDSMFFNNSSRWMSDKDTNFIFTGDKLVVVFKGNHYNFRLDEKTKESEDSYIRGRI